MRSREIPAREKRVPEAALRHDPQVKAWVRRLSGDPEAVPSDLSPQKLAFVMEEVMKRRGEEFDRTLYEKHMERLRPGLAMPAVTDQVEDMRTVFSLGEFREFWAAWTGRRGERGPAANVEGAKALMATMAVPGMTTHAVDAHELLDGHARLQGVFAELAADTDPDGEEFELPGYSSSLRIAHKIAPTARWEACKQTVALVRWLREHVPGFEQAGKRLLIDGSSIVAWAPQYGYGKDDPREAALREHAPEAGYRLYQYTAKGKLDGKTLSDKQVGAGTRRGKNKAWRGYHLVVIADQLTGLPLVWTLIDAAEDEAQAMVPLLRDLHELWPNIDADVIAGDSAYDEDWACRLCEVEYRIRPVFRRNPKPTTVKAKEAKKRGAHVYAFPQGTHRNALGRLHNGQLVCRHGKAMDYKKFDRPPLDGLRPGQPARPEGEFKVRGECPVHGKGSCGTIAVQCRHDWSSLTYYPHHRNGRPDLYAFRQALLHHLGQVEAIFASLKGAHGQGTPGADRGRVRKRTTHEALISLALLSHVALAVADVRLQREMPLDQRATPDDDQPTGGTPRWRAGARRAEPRPRPRVRAAPQRPVRRGGGRARRPAGRVRRRARRGSRRRRTRDDARRAGPRPDGRRRPRRAVRGLLRPLRGRGVSAPTTATTKVGGADAILRTLAGRTRPRPAAPPAAAGQQVGRDSVRAGLLRASVTRLAVDPGSGRWRFRVRVRHDARPHAVIYEEVRLGEPDAGDGTVDARLARHGWWTLDDLADAAACASGRQWVRPHHALGLFVDSVDDAARHVALWDASRAIKADLVGQRDRIAARARGHAGRGRYPILGRPTIPAPHDRSAT